MEVFGDAWQSRESSLSHLGLQQSRRQARAMRGSANNAAQGGLWGIGDGGGGAGAGEVSRAKVTQQRLQLQGHGTPSGGLCLI